MMGAPALKHSSQGEALSATLASAINEGDWEYEYDENETEDYYFTLDVTAHQTEALSKAYQPERKAQRRASNAPKNSSVRNEPTSRPTTAQDGGTQSDPSSPQPNGTASSEQDQRLQVLDLHSDNPLILLDHQLYSCRWSTDLGTQIYVTRAGVAEKPLRPGRVLDVVGMSQAKLIARPAIARLRKDNTATEIGSSTGNAISINEDDEHNNVDNEVQNPDDILPLDNLTATERFAKVRHQSHDPETKAKASFLERLSEIKQKKGETDQIPLYGVKKYTPPANKEEIRQLSMAADAEREEYKNTPNGKNPKSRSSKTKRISTSETIVTGTGQIRRKPGPKSNIALRGSLGLGGISPANSSSTIRPQNSDMQQSSPGTWLSEGVDG